MAIRTKYVNVINGIKAGKKVSMLVASCVIILLLGIGTPLIIHNGAADAAPVSINPTVDFPLGQYSLHMSSVPGFPMTITSEDADNISLRASEGKLLLWNRFSSIVIPQGKEATVKSGTTIYWTPLVEGAYAEKAMIRLTAYKDKHILGSSVIEIKMENHIIYTGKLTSK
jgi:hypothetical protein